MQIPDKVKKLFNKTTLISFGTADNQGLPNINIVFWKKILNNDTILLIDNFMNMTKKNLLQNNKVCLSFYDSVTEEGYKLKGIATYHFNGEVFDEGKKFIQLKNPKRIPKGVIEIKINEIYILTPGPNAGKNFTNV